MTQAQIPDNGHRDTRPTCKSLEILLATLLIAGPAFAAQAGDLKIERHETAGIINLVPGADRGTITQPLLMGTIASTGQEVYFVITDASDKDFAEMFSTVRADSLEETPDAAVETALFDGENWTFYNLPEPVAYFDEHDNVISPTMGNSEYSPLKRFEWNGKTITANVPFVKWGDGPGQQLLEDMGGCDPLIRSNPPSPFFVGNGPTNGADCSVEDPLDRYKGGQVVSPDGMSPGIDLTPTEGFPFGSVTMKLHKATFDHPDKIPYYTVFDASKLPPAGFMGVIHAPKVGGRMEDGVLVGGIGRFGDNDAVGRIAQFSNGVRIDAAGPNRFQQGITSYRGGQQGTYSPMWHISWIFFDCDGDGEFFDAEHNVGEGANPGTHTDDGHGFFPADPATFDPFQMFDKGVSCGPNDMSDFAVQVTGNADGFIEDLGQLADLIEAGYAIETEGPAGLRLDSTLQPPLIVNCPVPLTVR